jgi:tRNA threonylcarbamoyladenosine biosynthesis protein TsaE
MMIGAFGLEDLPRVAQAMLPALQNASVVAFHGNMGIGKTTLIKALCEAMGVAEVVNSPTFALVNEYHSGEGKTIYHFDFYRIENLEEVYDLGYEEYFYGNHLCFVEWPEKVLTLLPPDTLHVYMGLSKNEKRTVRF